MKTILFDDIKYDLAESYIDIQGDTLKVTVVQGDKSFDDVISEVPCKKMQVFDESETVIATYLNYGDLLSAELIKNYTIDKDTETGEEIKADVIKATLRQLSDIDIRVSDLEDTVDVLAEEILG